MRKRIIAVLTTAALAAALAACGGQKQEAASSSASSAAASSASTSTASASSSEAAEEGTAKMVGGWTIPEKINGYVPEEAQKAFDTAMKEYKDGELTAIDLFGTQVVAGTNYMILCQAKDRLKVAVVYEDLEGNAEITQVSDFDLGKYAQEEDSGAGEQGLAGGWTVNEDQPDGSMPEEAATAFSQAMEELVGADYIPALYLGSQVVSGANYAVLCTQTLVTKDPVTNLAMVYIYAPISGDAEVMNIYALDLADFNK